MKIKYVLSFVLVLLLINSTAFAQKLAPRKTELSSSMTGNQILQALRQIQPHIKNVAERHLIMQSLDNLVTVRVSEMTPDDISRLEEIFAIYTARVDDGLDALEQTRVTEGVHVFKFYSSSIILKGSKGTVAVDFCQGPIQNKNEPEIADTYKTGFYLTAEQRQRLASLVDVMLITHRHHDHCDYSLAKELMAHGKPVIGPVQLKSHWADIGADVTVPTYGTIQKFGPCEIRTQLGYQYGKNGEKDDGQRYGLPDTIDPQRNSESVRYLLKMEDIVFLQSAENQTEADDWLRQAEEKGWKVNVLLSPGQYQGGRSAMSVLHDYYRLPIHEYEMTHHGGGNRTAHLFSGHNQKQIKQEKMMPLFWGDDFHLSQELLAYTYASSKSLINTEPKQD